MDKNIINHDVNKTAYHYLRDIADGDYIMARTAFFSGLAAQFIISSHQAITNYLECIKIVQQMDTKKEKCSLYNFFEKVASYQNTYLSEETHRFIYEIDIINSKKLLSSYALLGAEYVYLDAAIWEIRQFCMKKEDIRNNHIKNNIFLCEKKICTKNIKHSNYYFPDGKLEKILIDKKNPAHRKLVTKNKFFHKNNYTSEELIADTEKYNANIRHHINNEIIYYNSPEYSKMPQKEDTITLSKIQNVIASQRIEFKEKSKIKNDKKSVELRQKLIPKVFSNEEKND